MDCHGGHLVSSGWVVCPTWEGDLGAFPDESILTVTSFSIHSYWPAINILEGPSLSGITLGVRRYMGL